VAAHQPAIWVEGLAKSYGKTPALTGLNLVVEPGTVLAMLGPNGAGKTTAVRILATLLRPDSGRAVVAGHDVVKDPAAVRERIALTGQYAALDDRLTGRENLVLLARLGRLSARSAKRRASDLLDRFGLAGAADRLAGTYSGGMRRRLDLAGSIVVPRQVVFLDEPTTGLDPRSRTGLWDVIGNLRAQGVTLVLTTQYLEDADRLADRIAVIDHGHIVAEGTATELKAHVGGQRLDVIVTEPAAVERAAQVLSGLGEGTATVDSRDRRVSLPVSAGLADLARAVSALAAASVAADDVALRRPTLDDAFFALTGAPPTATSNDPAAQALDPAGPAEATTGARR
jgi:ABC-2 type transport system ATP-binding protein